MRNWAYLFFLSFILWSCQSEEESQLEEIQYTLKINRLDIAMENFAKRVIENPDSSYQYFQTYFGEHLDFIRAWNYNVGDTVISDTIIASDFSNFLTDKPTLALLDSVRKLYPVDEKFPYFEKALKRLKLYFKDFEFPKIYTYITGYPPYGAPAPIILERDQLFITPEYWGISLDYFLGTNADYHMDIPMYMRRKCRKEYILTAILMKYVSRWQPPLRPEKMPTFGERVIHQGIKIYFAHKIAPEIPDSLLLSYTPEQLEWVNYFEKNIYNELVPYFFKSDPKLIEKYLQDRPFTQGLDRQSPGRLGEFLGYKIVSEYMRNHPEVTLEQLVKTTDYQKIIKESKYKP
jgi:hypothetical protein